MSRIISPDTGGNIHTELLQVCPSIELPIPIMEPLAHSLDHSPQRRKAAPQPSTLDAATP